MLNIRPFHEEDAAAVLELWEIVFPGEPSWNNPATAVQRKLSMRRELFLVAEIGRTIIGTVMGGDDGYRGWVYYVAVHPDHRMQGVGTRLMCVVERRLSEIGCPQLNLLVRHNGIEAAGFYKRLGYEVEPKICMAKRL